MRMYKVCTWIVVWLLLITNAAGAVTGFNPKDFPHRIDGKHFTVWYATTGPEQVTSEFAQKTLSGFELSYDKLVAQAGFRPARVEPVPVVLQAAEPQLGGEVCSDHFGYDLYVQINPNSSVHLEDAITHEFFHVVQKSYESHASNAIWAVEGTAPVPTMYVYDGSPSVREYAMKSLLSEYWSRHREGLKHTKYTSSLFFYWLSDRYGGIAYLRRLLAWSEDLEWERAIQLAALESGAPEDITFDRLWRSFVFAMVDGKMPEGYKPSAWFSPDSLKWNGTAAQLTHGAARSGATRDNRLYSVRPPLALPPYSFNLVEVTAHSSTPFALTVQGDPLIEAYLIRPGPAVKWALEDRLKRPSPTHRIAPPTDPLTTVNRLELGKPVRLDGGYFDRYLVLVLRTGHWGSGGYSVGVQPAAPGTPAASWQSLSSLPHPPDSPGSPPPLSAAELVRLRTGTLDTGAADVLVDSFGTARAYNLKFKEGDTAIWDGEKAVPLPVPITQMGDQIQGPMKALVRLMGGTAEGNRLTLGDAWIELTPGSNQVKSSQKTIGMVNTVREENGELISDMTALMMLDVFVAYSPSNGVQYLTYPNPRK
ncbi:MAG TPA: hypothetical protein VD902_03080 [Symbiobacteriaceae bacterium]|nr:hypothetical protein [Symbiobacteriaceae bacterium]